MPGTSSCRGPGAVRITRAPRVVDRGTAGVPGDVAEYDSCGRELAVGDFDGDGYSDLAVGGFSARALVLWGPGDGPTGATWTVPARTTPWRGTRARCSTSRRSWTASATASVLCSPTQHRPPALHALRVGQVRAPGQEDADPDHLGPLKALGGVPW
ncbi:FG-GAP repeat protein [Streptomyces sp. NPDC127108]|uniref:FG-GAP repeat protein n=1 Tax=Streptomyces sp. NPDC127108 TaxID=3345361 RepID=UPI00363925BC